MNCITQLDELLRQARNSGFEVRFEYLGGTGGGVCEFNGQRWLFVDLALAADESLEILRESLRAAGDSHSPSLRRVA